MTYSRATYEINKGCNFSCEHCYLELRPFEGLALPDKLRLIDMLVDMGVLWFQITGGEPLIDPDSDAEWIGRRNAPACPAIIDPPCDGGRRARPRSDG